jgi:hypothetical protein
VYVNLPEGIMCWWKCPGTFSILSDVRSAMVHGTAHLNLLYSLVCFWAVRRFQTALLKGLRARLRYYQRWTGKKWLPPKLE